MGEGLGEAVPFGPLKGKDEALAEGEAEKPKACEEAPHGSTLALLLEDEVSEAEKPGGPPPALWV